MSAIGFDIGNENCAIAVAKHGVIDVLLNDESKRETPAVVSFGEKQRFLGSAGAAFATKNPESTISQIKRLIGRHHKEPSVQEDLKLLPFETSASPRGGILIHLQYLKERLTFTPVEILGMLFAHLKQVTEKNLQSPVEDCVIGIPSYFTDLQRREYLHAAFIAGLKPLKLIHDCTAVALGYGMYKTDFSNKGPTNVIFVDIGQSDTQVTVAAFEQRKMEILSHSFDQNLGGRDFDEVLCRHFATQFKKQYNIDVYSNPRATIKLRALCEKLKKVLSVNAEAPISIECLIDDKDLIGSITREEFENLSVDLLKRVTDVCFKAREESRLHKNKIHTIELVGSGSRIPAIVGNLTLLFGKEPMRTLNGSECVARGCALSCAMHSRTLRVKKYKVQDIFPYSVGLSFKAEERRHSEHTPFPKGSPFPSNTKLTYHGNATFCCQVFYKKMDFPSGISPIVGDFMINPSQTSGEKYVNATVNVQLNTHGIFEIESASVIESASLLEVIQPSISYIVQPGRWMLNYNKPVGSSQLTAHHDAEAARRSEDRMKKLVVYENSHVLTTPDEIIKALERAQIFKEKDIKVEQTKEKRNTLESFIYDTRSKLSSSYRSVATDSELKIISKKLDDIEEWLNEEGYDESEQVYINKLEDLKKSVEIIEGKYKDEKARKEAKIDLQACIQEYRSIATNLPLSLKKKVNNECVQAEEWLKHLPQLQNLWDKNAYCSSAITGITQDLTKRCELIRKSELSFEKYDEHVDHSDPKQNLVDMQDLWDQTHGI